MESVEELDIHRNKLDKTLNFYLNLQNSHLTNKTSCFPPRIQTTIMELYQHSVYTLKQCKQVLSGLSQKDYIYRSHLIPNSSISKHVRHTLERFGVFIQSLSSQSSVDFDIATKDRRIESDLAYSKKMVDSFIDFFQKRDNIESARNECTLTVYTPDTVSMPSTYAREVSMIVYMLNC